MAKTSFVEYCVFLILAVSDHMSVIRLSLSSETDLLGFIMYLKGSILKGFYTSFYRSILIFCKIWYVNVQFYEIFTNYMHSYLSCIHSYKIYFQSEILTGIIKDTAHMAAFPLQGAKCVFELLMSSIIELCSYTVLILCTYTRCADVPTYIRYIYTDFVELFRMEVKVL